MVGLVVTKVKAHSLARINGTKSFVNLAGSFTYPVLNPFRLAPAEDTPTITQAAVTTSALKSGIITDSAGWFREKRIGVAENTPGVNQTSSANLDFDLTTRYRYLAVPQPVAGSASNAPQYVSTPIKPGGTPQAAYWLFNLEFVTSSPQVSFRINTVTTNATFGMIYVNGLRVQENSWRMTSAGGASYEIVLTFPSAAARTIKIVGMNNNQGRWGGVGVAGGYTVSKPTTPAGPLFAIIGDSWVNGASTYPDGTNATETYPWRLAHLMGYTNILQAGIGGTGYVATTGGVAESNFAGRVDAVVAMNPDVLIFSGGRNDDVGTSASIQAAVESCLDRTSTVPKRYVVSTAANSQTVVQGAIIAGAASRGVQFIDVDRDAIPKGTDGIHPTFDGHRILAEQIFSKL